MVFPMEIITMFGSTLMGGVLKLWGMRQEDDRLHRQAILDIHKEADADTLNARQMAGPETQWTRRNLLKF